MAKHKEEAATSQRADLDVDMEQKMFPKIMRLNSICRTLNFGKLYFFARAGLGDDL